MPKKIELQHAKPTDSLFKGVSQFSLRAGQFSLGRWLVRTTPGEMEYHGHAEPHFMYVPPSCGYATDASGHRPRNESNLIFNPSQTYHRDRLTTPGWFFSISLPTAAEWLEPRVLPASPSQLGTPRAHSAVSNLIKVCNSRVDDSALTAEAICFELIGLSGSSRTKEAIPPRWLAAAVEYFRDGGWGHPSVEEAGKLLGVHPVHIARVFRKFYGCTPGEYLRDVRIRRSQRLLSQSKLTLSEVACASGFADQSHFTKQFSVALNISPGEYRRLTSIYTVRTILEPLANDEAQGDVPGVGRAN